jgi:copper chaperone
MSTTAPCEASFMRRCKRQFRLISAYPGRPTQASAPDMKQSTMITLNVTGMTCDGCAKAVERIIKSQDPQAAVIIDLGSGRVEARTAVPPAALVQAIEAAGYGAKPA